MCDEDPVGEWLDQADRAIIIAFRDGDAQVAHIKRRGRQLSVEDLARDLEVSMDYVAGQLAEIEGCEPWQIRWR